MFWGESGWDDWLDRDDVTSPLFGILKGGTLTLKVRIRPHYQHYCTVNTQRAISKNLLKLYLNNDGADLAFRMNDQVILPAHRIILKCCAPQLAELAETYDTNNPMPVEDVEPDTFKAILSVVYGGSIAIDEWKAQAGYFLDPAKKGKSILLAANKYGFNSLRLEAEEWYLTFHKLNVRNVIDNLIKADGCNFSLLKKAAMDFIAEHPEEVVTSESYKNLEQSTALLSEVVIALAKKLGRKRKRSN